MIDINIDGNKRSVDCSDIIPTKINDKTLEAAYNEWKKAGALIKTITKENREEITKLREQILANWDNNTGKMKPGFKIKKVKIHGGEPMRSDIGKKGILVQMNEAKSFFSSVMGEAYKSLKPSQIMFTTSIDPNVPTWDGHTLKVVFNLGGSFIDSSGRITPVKSTANDNFGMYLPHESCPFYNGGVPGVSDNNNSYSQYIKMHTVFMHPGIVRDLLYIAANPNGKTNPFGMNNIDFVKLFFFENHMISNKDFTGSNPIIYFGKESDYKLSYYNINSKPQGDGMHILINNK